MISENKEKLQATDVSTIEGLIKEGRAAVEKQDDAGVTEALDKLEKEAHKLASVMYQSAAPGEGGPGGPDAGPGANAGAEGAGQASSTGKKDSGVIDAEFEESSP